MLKTTLGGVALLSLFLFAPANAWAQGGEVLYNGITLPSAWPPTGSPTQLYKYPTYLSSPPAVIPIDVGRQLFVDDFLIANTTLTRKMHRPVMQPNFVIGVTQNGEKAIPFSDGAWYDPADNLHKMWYWCGGPFVCYSYSLDGKNWINPALPDSYYKDTNIVIYFGGGRDSGTVWMDLEDPNPARKFKGFFYGGGERQRVFFSPDGIHWTEQAGTIYSLSDRTTFFWNPFRKVWVESARGSANLPLTPSNVGRASIRSRYYMESKDLTNWLPAKPWDVAFWLSVDETDPPYPGTKTLPHLYNLDAVAYESLIVGLFSLYYPDPNPYLVELNAGFSRDGYQWVRPTRGGGDNAFIPATNREGDWNAYNTQSVGGGFTVVGDELYFYFSGRSAKHGVAYEKQTMSTGLATLRRDGFYSMDAGSGEGTLTTRPLKFSGKYMFVNVNAPSGALRVEALDEAGNVIAPFTRANSSVLTGNSTKQAVTWSGASDLSSLSGRNVRFRFYLTNGELYAFWVTPDIGGASFGYVAAGGPGFISNRDTGAFALDQQKPSAPTALQAEAKSATQVSLGWAASTDDVGVTVYRIVRDGVQIGTSSTTSYIDNTVQGDTTYSYRVGARDAAGNESDLSSAVPVKTPVAVLPVAVAPTVSPNGGTFTGSVTVGFATPTSGATIYYTTNGATPTTSSPVFAAPFVLTASSTVKAIATKAGYTNSAVASATFTITAPAPVPIPVVATPTFSPNGGTFSGSASVAITSATPSATIYYTTNGATPTASSAVYTTPISITGSATVKAMAARSGYTSSDVASAAFTITAPPSTGTYLSIEAESASILSPMQSLYMGPARVSNGFFIRNNSAEKGTVTYTVNITTSGTYQLWGRGSSTGIGGSFYVSLDDGPEELWSVETWTSRTDFTWAKFALLPPAGSPAGTPLEPRTFSMTAGSHKITLRGAAVYSYLDVMLLTNDLGYVPKSISGK